MKSDNQEIIDALRSVVTLMEIVMDGRYTAKGNPYDELREAWHGLLKIIKRLENER